MQLDFELATLREQPLGAAEKQVLSEYFQLEGRRQFELYGGIDSFGITNTVGLYAALNFNFNLLQELSDKQLTLELSCRDHWINLIKSIHREFYRGRPNFYELMYWTALALEKHAVVKIETGQDEYRYLLQEMQRRQLTLLGSIPEGRIKQFNQKLQLFYQLLDIPGLNTSLIRV